MSEHELVVKKRFLLVIVTVALIGISVYVLRRVDDSIFLYVAVIILIVLICILFTFPLKITINQSGIEIRRLAGSRLIKWTDITEWNYLHGTEGDRLIRYSVARKNRAYWLSTADLSKGGMKQAREKILRYIAVNKRRFNQSCIKTFSKMNELHCSK